MLKNYYLMNSRTNKRIPDVNTAREQRYECWGGHRGLGVKGMPDEREVRSSNLNSAKSFFKISLSSQNQRLFLPFHDNEKVDLNGGSQF